MPLVLKKTICFKDVKSENEIHPFYKKYQFYNEITIEVVEFSLLCQKILFDIDKTLRDKKYITLRKIVLSHLLRGVFNELFIGIHKSNCLYSS